MNIPDPVELMEARTERLIDQWDAAQKDVPEGEYRCPFCLTIFDYEPLPFGPSPDSPRGCAECAGYSP